MNAANDEIDWSYYTLRLLWMLPVAIVVAYAVFCLVCSAAMLILNLATEGRQFMGALKDELLVLFLYFFVGLFILLCALPVVLLVMIPFWLAAFYLMNRSWRPSVSAGRFATWTTVVAIPLPLALAAWVFGLLGVSPSLSLFPLMWLSGAIVAPFFVRWGLNFAN